MELRAMLLYLEGFFGIKIEDTPHDNINNLC